MKTMWYDENNERMVTTDIVRNIVQE